MSLWNNIKIENQTKKLTQDKTVDILIIGSGMTGLTTAYYLKDESSLCVVDSSKIGHGVTLNTTAKINYFQERNYTKIKSLTNEKNAILYLKSQINAVNYLKDIIEKEKIDCDFKKVPSYVFANTQKEIKPLKKEIQFLKHQGVKVIKDKVPDTYPCYDSYRVDDTYVFHPLKYLKGICRILNEKKIPIYEGITINNIQKEKEYYQCFSKDIVIKAKKVIFAGHYPFFLLPFIPGKSYIEKSYIIISRTNQKKDYTCISSASPTYSCRFHTEGKEKYQISLGKSHNTAFTCDDKKNFEEVKKLFHLKEEDIFMSYSNVDIMTFDLMPYIGKFKENMYLSTGYNTWGMTNSVLGAKILSDLIKKKENPYVKIFHPLRKNIALYSKLPYYIASQTKSYLGTKLIKQKSWYSKCVYFEQKDGQNLGVFIDNNGKKHIVYNKCPHLGCSLIFNEKEYTWDCPCHSSRFDIDGNCIKGPSTKNIGYQKK